MRLLAWVPQEYDTSPGQRFRIEQWEPYLRRNGFEVTFSPFSDEQTARFLQQPGRIVLKIKCVLQSLARRLREARRLAGFDLVFIFRESALLGPAWAEYILMRRRIPFVFDFDDAVWVRYVSQANSYLSFLRCPSKTAYVCRRAAHVLAGNAYLHDYAARYNRSVTVIPTTIDTKKYKRRAHAENSIPVIGWTGSYSTERHLEMIRHALERLRRRWKFRLVVVGGGRFRSHEIDVEHRPWRAETEVDDLSDIDIGVMPLPDEPWERGKCGLKALQFMALEIPVVASPVGVNREIIEHEMNGLLASSEEDWIASLELLLMDEQKRAQWGRLGRQTVEARYSVAVQAPRVDAILRSVIL